MRVAIEMNTLRVTHVHPDMAVLDALAYLEGTAGARYLVDNAFNRSFLHGLTTLELNQLYHNLTGQDLPIGVSDLVRREAIAHVVMNLTPRDAVLDELLSQCEVKGDNPEVEYRYVRGALVPAEAEKGLWPVQGAPLSGDAMTAAQQAAPSKREPKPATTTPAAPKPERSRPAVSAPTGGSRPIIWAHADKRWEEAGKPTAVSDVLALRKKWMVELEEQGIKKSTSSTALGDWMKARVTAS